MVTLRQPLGHERRPAQQPWMQESGKEGYGDPSGQAGERPGKGKEDRLHGQLDLLLGVR